MCCIFFFNDTATTEIYTLSLHDALPIYGGALPAPGSAQLVTPGGHERSVHGVHGSALLPQSSGHQFYAARPSTRNPLTDRKSTRLNSSHANISYAVFCLKKKKND